MSRSLDINGSAVAPSILPFPELRKELAGGFSRVCREIQQWIARHADTMTSSAFLPSILVNQLPSNVIERGIMFSRLVDLPSYLAIRQPMLEKGVLFLSPQRYIDLRQVKKDELARFITESLKEELFIPEASNPPRKSERNKPSESPPPEVSFPGGKIVPPLRGIFSVRVQDSGFQKADPIIIETGRLNLSADDLEEIYISLNGGIVRIFLRWVIGLRPNPPDQPREGDRLANVADTRDPAGDAF